MNSQWIKDLNLSSETIMFYKKMKKSLLGIGITSDLLNVIAQPRKAKTNKWNHIKKILHIKQATN